MVKTLLYVLLVLACLALCFFSAKGRPKGKKISMLDTKIFKGEGSILVTDMTKEGLFKAIDDFINIYTQDGVSYTKPSIRAISQGFLLTFDGDIDYMAFCFWVNYLVYSDKNVKHNEHVTGWLKVKGAEDEILKTFDHQTLMCYIPSSDTEYDNVYFTTSDGQCFKQEFAFRQNLIEQTSIVREYHSMPR